ncbi:zinc finger protein 142-like [Planococcus citri]|uniref:zinc finger protein 142-like n=1 Tax=Planococcus citri TaxID=170843 RepID=UPI0031F8AA01
MFRNTTDTCIYNHLIQRGENLLKDNSEKYHSYVDQQEVLRLQFIWVNNDYKFLKSWLDIACEDSLMMKSDHGDLVSHYKVLLQNNLVKEILDYGEARETLQLRFIALMSQCKDLKSCLDAANKNMISLKSACNDSSRGNEVLQNKVSTAEFLDYSRQRETLHLKCVEAIDECERLNKRLTEAHETITLLNSKHVDLASRFQVLSTNEMVKEFFDCSKVQEKLQPNVTEKIEEDECITSCIEQANENTKLLNLQLTEVKETLLMERLRFEQILNEKQSLSHLSDQLRCLLSKYQATMNEEIDEISTTTDESAQNSTNIYNESDSSSVSKISITEMRIGTENAGLCTNSNLNHQHSNIAENNHPIVGGNNNGEPNSSHISDITIVESQIEIKEEDLCDDSSQDRQLSNPGESNDDLIEVKDEITDENTETLNVDVVVLDKSTEKSSETDSLPKTMMELDDGISKKFRCGVCDQLFSTSSSLEEHMNSHKKRKNVPSRIPRVRECLKIPTTSSKQHVDNSQDKKEECPSEPSVLKEAPLFSCANCNKNYRNERDFSGDMGTHTSRSEQSAKNCVENPKDPRANESDLNNAEKSVSKPAILKTTRHFSCTQCDKKYPNESGLSNHMKMHANSSKQHAVKSQDKNNTEIRRDSSCCHCDGKCSNESDLSGHTKKHKSSSKQSANTSINKKKRKRAYESDDSEDHRDFSCIHCDKNYPNESDLSDHMTHKNSSVLRTKSSQNEKKRKRVCEPENLCTFSCVHCDRKYSEESDLSEHVKEHTNSLKQRVDKSHDEKKRNRISESEDHDDFRNKSSAHSDKKNLMKKDLPSSSPKQNLDNSHNNNKKKKLICKPKDPEVSGSSSSAHSDERNPTKKKLPNLAAPAASRPKQHLENSHNNRKTTPLIKTKDPKISSNNSSAHSNEKNPIKKRLSDLSKKKSLSKPKDPEVSGSNPSAHSDERNPTKKKLSNVTTPSVSSSKQHSENSHDNIKKKLLSKPKDTEGSRNNSSVHSDGKNPTKKDVSSVKKPSASSSQQHTKNVLSQKKKKPVCKPKDPKASRNFSCAHCDEKYSKESDLSDHMKTHRKNSLNQGSNDSSNPKKRKRICEQEDRSSKKLAKNVHNEEQKNPASKPKAPKVSVSNSSPHCDIANSDLTTSTTRSPKQHVKNAHNNKKKSLSKPKKPAEVPGKSSSAHSGEKSPVKSEISDLMEPSTSSPQQHAGNSRNNERKASKSEPKDPEVLVDNVSARTDEENSINKNLSDPTAPSTSGSKRRAENSQNVTKKKKKPICKPKDLEVTSNNSSAHGESELSNLIEPSTSSQKTHEENSRNNKEKTSTDQAKDAEILRNNSSERVDEKNPIKNDLSDVTESSTGSLQQQSNQPLNKTKKKQTLESQVLEPDSRLHCAHCEKTCLRKSDLASHVKTHMSNLYEQNPHFIKKEIRESDEIYVYYNCKYCDKKYRRKKEMVQHVKIHTEPGFKDTLKCNICGKSFASKVSLNYHQTVHTSDKLHKCAFCHVRFKSSSSRIRHESKFHKSDDKVYCAHCDKAFNRKANLEKHIEEKHINFKEIRCDICQKEFPVQYLLTEHKRIIHEKKRPFQCDECGKTFITKHKLKTHELTHKPRDHSNMDTHCDLCKRHFSSKSNLKEHMKMIHDGIKPFKCPTCGRKFYKKKDLEHHLTLYDLGDHVKCSFCDKSFHFDVNRIKHEEVHQGKGDGFGCAHCDKVYFDKVAITRHLREKHPEYIVDPWKCIACGKCFVTKSYLENHEMKEHDIDEVKPIKCTLCDARFRLKNSLSAHKMRKHKGTPRLKPVRRYECKICPKVFFVRSSFRSHVYKKHRNERKNISEAKEQDSPVPEPNREDVRESTEMNVSGITELEPPELSKGDPPELSKEDHLELNAGHFPELNKLDPVELNKKQSLELNKLDPVELNKERSLELSKLDPVELNTEQSPELSKEDPPEIHEEHSSEISREDPPELSKEGSPELKPSTTIVLPLSAY